MVKCIYDPKFQYTFSFVDLFLQNKDFVDLSSDVVNFSHWPCSADGDFEIFCV